MKPDRDFFERIYAAERAAVADGLVTVEDLVSLRRGDKYPDGLVFLNGAWLGFQLAHQNVLADTSRELDNAKLALRTWRDLANDRAQTVAELKEKNTALERELGACTALASMVEDGEFAEHVGVGPTSKAVESALLKLHKAVNCQHEFVDDGLFQLVCTKCPRVEDHEPPTEAECRDLATRLCDAAQRSTTVADMVALLREAAAALEALELHDEDPTLQPEAQAEPEAGQARWRDMDTAPTDGTMVRLLVEFTEHSTEDSERAATIGFLTYDGDDESLHRWQFAGWCWSHDHFTEGEGTPVGWLPLQPATE